MKTSAQMVNEIRACKAIFITYGNSDLGIPIKKEDAIADIISMDDEAIGDGTWYECDENGLVSR